MTYPTPPRSVIGVDCATVAKEVGLARARFEDGRWRLLEARVASPVRPPAEVLVDWLRDGADALLALDAPLGWPAALGPALTAHLAGDALPLAWEPAVPDAPAAIEVYPAATLRVHGLPDRGYKDPHAVPRAAIDAWLRSRLDVAADVDLVAASGHVLDAVLCVAAGLDFLAGAAPGPDDPETGRREGWIWVAH